MPEEHNVDNILAMITLAKLGYQTYLKAPRRKRYMGIRNTGNLWVDVDMWLI